MRNMVLLCAVLFGALLVVSCQRQDIEADKAAIRALVESDTVHFNAGTKGDSAGGSYLLDDTMVGLWWRGPQTHDSAPTIEVGVVGDSAWVGWHQHNYGELIHWVKTSDTTATRWVKPLKEAVQLNAIFRREGKTSDTDRGWRLKKISLVLGRSDTFNTVRIDSVRIHTSLRDAVIVDPLNTYYHLDSLFWFTPGEELTLTLYTNQDDGFAHLHAFIGPILWRFPLENMGNGVYQGTGHVQLIPGFRFAIFDFLSHGTLLDPNAPYDFSGWLFPYVIKTAD
ncbi:MAG: hypothetical protein ABIK44_02080 [candidate division WOR-3 bacterium]